MESHDRNVCNFSFPRRQYFHSHQHCSRVPGVLHILTIMPFEGFFIQNGFIEVELIYSALLISAVEQNGSGTRAYSALCSTVGPVACPSCMAVCSRQSQIPDPSLPHFSSLSATTVCSLYEPVAVFQIHSCSSTLFKTFPFPIILSFWYLC